MKKHQHDYWDSDTRDHSFPPKGFNRKYKVDENHPKQLSPRKIYGWKEYYSGVSSNYLRRFLNKNVGRPWDKVYSEMLKNTSGVHRDQIKGFVRYYVEVNAYIDGEKVYSSDGFVIRNKYRPRDYRRDYLNPFKFWVDKQGILRKA